MFAVRFQNIGLFSHGNALCFDVGGFDTVYIIMIIVGFGLGVAIYVLNSFVLSKDKRENKLKATAVFGISVVPALVLGFVLNLITYP